jgi:hypothetical protein
MTATRNTWKPSARIHKPSVAMEPIVDSCAWYPQDLAGTDAWIYRLSGEEIAEIEGAVAAVEARGLALMEVDRQAFPLPRFARVLADVRSELMDGRGMAVIRGLPTEGRTRLQLATAYWGVGSYLGRPMSQNAQGHLLGHVKDIGADYTKTRGYGSNAELAYHCDRCDIAALLCLHPAKSGGLYSITSSATIYNEMLKRRPELAKELLWQFYMTRNAEIVIGETQPFARLPVFSFHEGYFTARGAGTTVEKAQKLPGVPKLTPAQREAIDMYRVLAAELHLDSGFEAGDMTFVMSHVTVHSRTEFEDWPEENRKRHLLRLWLNNGERPLSEENRRENAGIIVEKTVLQTPLEVTA